MARKTHVIHNNIS